MMSHHFANASQEHLRQIVRIWNDGWNDAHAAIVPDELIQMRTLKSLEARAQKSLARTRVLILDNQVAAFHMLKGDELDQFFVGRAFRGKGIATLLIGDAETQLKQRGTKTAWLACAIGNERAARFYVKSGWTFVREEPIEVYSETGGFMLDIWRYEKRLIRV